MGVFELFFFWGGGVHGGGMDMILGRWMWVGLGGGCLVVMSGTFFLVDGFGWGIFFWVWVGHIIGWVGVGGNGWENILNVWGCVGGGLRWVGMDALFDNAQYLML